MKPTDPVKAGSVHELIEFVMPGARAHRCPPWPPDVFAVAATVMKRTGAYVQLRARGLLNDTDLESLRQQLKTPWGRQVFESLKSNEAPNAEDRMLLERFSTAFAA